MIEIRFDFESSPISLIDFLNLWNYADVIQDDELIPSELLEKSLEVAKNKDGWCVRFEL